MLHFMVTFWTLVFYLFAIFLFPWNVWFLTFLNPWFNNSLLIPHHSLQKLSTTLIFHYYSAHLPGLEWFYYSCRWPMYNLTLRVTLFLNFLWPHFEYLKNNLDPIYVWIYKIISMSSPPNSSLLMVLSMNIFCKATKISFSIVFLFYLLQLLNISFFLFIQPKFCSIFWHDSELHQHPGDITAFSLHLKCPEPMLNLVICLICYYMV